MTLVICICLAALGIWIVARESGYERGWDDAEESINELLAAREKSVVAREARKRCEVGRVR
jgi:hypothetical protein